jgi:hypothetical protein
MDLLDRYLNAVRWNLPRAARADDIIAELRDVISSRIEDREESLDRSLTQSEVSDLLRDCGHPLVMASRYGTHQSLIGPDIFPFYLFSLKVVLSICALILVIQGAANVLFGSHDVMHALMQMVGGGFWSLLGNAGLVTLIFAVIERTGWLTEHFREWKPEDLPDLSDVNLKGIQPKPQRGWESAFEVAVGIAFILWWAGLIHIPIMSNVPGMQIKLAPVWHDLWWPILILLVARLIHNLVAWLRPRWKAIRAVLSVGTTVGALALLGIIYKAGHWVDVWAPNLPAKQLADIQDGINTGLHVAIIVVGVIWVFGCLQELWRIWGRPLPLPF